MEKKKKRKNSGYTAITVPYGILTTTNPTYIYLEELTLF